MRVVDMFPFYNEREVLRARVRELAPVVDLFVLCECFETHQGDPKPFHYREDDFDEETRRKIVCVRIREAWPFGRWGKSGRTRPPPGRMLPQDWLRENCQRNALCEALARVRLAPSDVLMVSDVDEVPRREAVPALRGMMRDDPDRLVVLTMPMMRLRADLLDPDSCPDHPSGFWHGTYAVTARHACATYGQDLSLLRMRRHAYLSALGGGPNRELRNAGWHLTWLGDYDAYCAKAAAVARHYAGNYEGEERSEAEYGRVLARLHPQPASVLPRHFREALAGEQPPPESPPAEAPAEPPRPHPTLLQPVCRVVDAGVRAVCDSFQPHNTLEGLPLQPRLGEACPAELRRRAAAVLPWAAAARLAGPLLLEDGWNAKLRADAAPPPAGAAAFGRPLGAAAPLLVPDPDTLTGLPREAAAAIAAAPAWEARAASAVFRGSSTGGLWSHDPADNPRVQLCGAPGVDARLTEWVQYLGEPPAAAAPGPRLSVAEQLRHRVLLHADGNAAPWSATLWKLSNGVSVTVWYARRHEGWLPARPWEHYVPCDDLAELPALLSRCYAGEFVDVARRAREMCEQALRELDVASARPSH